MGKARIALTVCGAGRWYESLAGETTSKPCATKPAIKPEADRTISC
jgi:hypothetical protein